MIDCLDVSEPIGFAIKQKYRIVSTNQLYEDTVSLKVLSYFYTPYCVMKKKTNRFGSTLNLVSTVSVDQQ